MKTGVKGSETSLPACSHALLEPKWGRDPGFHSKSAGGFAFSSLSEPESDGLLGEGIVAPQDDVGAVLAFLVEADFGERLDAVAARKPGQFTHTATTSVPKCSSGTGRPSSFKAAM